MRRSNLLLLCVAFFAALVVWGCDSVWLPDSSGILFIRSEDHTLVHYDIPSKAERVVARYDWILSDGMKSLPAIAPDGKQAALIRHSAAPAGIKVQVFVHELSGKQVHVSKEFDVPCNFQGKPQPWQGLGRAYWSHDGRRIVFFLITQCEHDASTTPTRIMVDTNDYSAGVYDLQTGSVQLHGNIEEVEELATVGLTPIAPGERGFLCQLHRPPPPSGTTEVPPSDNPAKDLLLIDWQGRRHEFTATPAAIEETKRGMSENRKRQKETVPGTPPAPFYGRFEEGSWKGSLATFCDSDMGLTVFDCEKRTVDMKPPIKDDPIRKYAEAAKVNVMAWDDGILLQFREKPVVPGADGQPSPEGSPCEIEVLRRAAQGAQWQTLPIARTGPCDWLIPAADRKHVLVFAVDENDRQKQRLLIISREGKLVADLKRTLPDSNAKAGPPLPEIPPSAPQSAPPAPRVPAAPTPDPGV